MYKGLHVNYLAKPFRTLLVACVCLALFPGVPGAQTARESQSTDGQDASNGIPALLRPEKVSVNAKGAVLMDAATGQILLENNKDQKIEPASFVKVLTLYVAFDLLHSGRVKLSDEVFVSQKAWKTGGSQMFIEVNNKVVLEDLIKGIAVVSGNDACVALAEHLYGSTEDFVNVMNETAQKIGMKNTFLKNPHGLPDSRQYTTPYDMALLARQYIHDFPEALRYHSMLEFTYAGITQQNRNGLLRKDESVDGLKTGYIADSGYHLLATAKRGNRRLIAVVMGTNTISAREQEARKLLNYGYQNFDLLALFTKGQVIAELPVWKGRLNTVSVVAADNGMITVPTQYKGKVHEDRFLPQALIAPITKGQVIGNSLIRLDTDVVKNIPLVAETEIQKAGLLKLLTHTIFLAGKNSLAVVAIIAVILLAMTSLYVLLLKGRREHRRSSFRL
jgi:serine-type D-Ala-D-Ala carboxypeptidase (penicillin-binding protein 5/6)